MPAPPVARRRLAAPRALSPVVGPLVALLLAAGLALVAPGAAGGATIGCDGADEVIVLTDDAELDPTCRYTGGFEIVSSGVTLDCRGARIESDGPPGGRWGILVHAPVDVALSDVTVTNCTVEGFLNNVKITRDGFKGLAEGVEYEHGFADIRLEGNTFRGSTGVGVYVDGYVTGVTIEDNLITGTGSSGIYLETGSAHSQVLGNRIVANGYRENGPNGQAFEVDGVPIWFWGVGREGVAVDGARFNTIAGNHFEGNSVGGVLLYKNCGEYPDSPRYFERRYGAHGNTIEGNRFVGEINGVWVGSRMAENTLPMDCTDPAYIDEPLRRVVLDHASDNVVRANTFDDVTYGVRVEDDDVVVDANVFTGPEGNHPVIAGTPLRTEVLDRPVRGLVLTSNRSEVVDTPTPYRWVHGLDDTTDVGNAALGRVVPLCEGEDPPRSPFVFVIALTGWDPSGPPPPTPPGLALPVLEPLDACALPVDDPEPTVPDPPPEPTVTQPSDPTPTPSTAAPTTSAAPPTRSSAAGPAQPVVAVPRVAG